MKYAIYGIGAECLKYTWEFMAKIDVFIDEYKADQIFWGKKICRLSEVDFDDYFIFISPIVEYYEIKKQLCEAGLEENKNFVWAPDWFGNEDIPSPYASGNWMEKEKDYDMINGEWNQRVRQVAQMIPDKACSVMDLGAGAMTLKKYISNDIEYIPVDYCKRCDDTVVCDFLKYEFPDRTADCIVLSGVLEYMVDVDWFISEVCKHTEFVVATYNPIETLNDFKLRHNNTWKNNMTFFSLVSKFEKNHFKLIDERITKTTDIIFCFCRG